jgi:hypothetical protein
MRDYALEYELERKKRDLDKVSSPGLVDLLKRQGVEPTMVSNLDIKLAREFMPKSYKGE